MVKYFICKSIIKTKPFDAGYLHIRKTLTKGKQNLFGHYSLGAWWLNGSITRDYLEYEKYLLS